MDPRATGGWDTDTFARGGTVDSKRLWSGGAATAVVAAGTGLVGVLVLRGILDVPVLTPSEDEQLFSGAGVMVPFIAAVAALASTALLHVLVLSTPRPQKFFSWITGLVLAVVVLQVFLANSPFLSTGEFMGVDEVIEQLATAALYLVIGAAIISLLSGISRTAITRRSSSSMRYDDRYYRDSRGQDGYWDYYDDPRARDYPTRQQRMR